MDLAPSTRSRSAARRRAKLRGRAFAERFAAELSIKPLESRYVFDLGLPLAVTTQLTLQSGNLVLNDVASGGRNDAFILQADTSQTVRPYDYYLIHDPGAVFDASGVAGAMVTGDGNTVEIPFESITGNLITVNALGGDDSLEIDFSLGNLEHGLIFDGGAPTTGLGDDLTLTGGSFDTVTHRFSDASSGTIDITGNSRIEYRGLEPIADNLQAAHRVFHFSDGDDVITLQDALGAGLNTIDSNLGESVTFLNPTASLTVQTGLGNNTVTVGALDAGFLPATLAIEGDGDGDTLVVETSNPAATAPLFSFAGFTFDQTATPTQAVALPNGVVNDSPDPFTIGLSPGAPTGVVAFPESASGFAGNLSLGSLLTSGSTVRAINLPAGNVGTEFRSGIELSWGGGQTLVNAAGNDFVVYESSSNPTGPDGFLVQVHVAGGGWTRLRYELHDSRQNYVGSTSAGAFATAFDLSSFGLSSTAAIDAIRIVSMTSGDRIDPVGAVFEPRAGANVGFGFILPDDNGATSNIFPDPGPLASFTFFGASTFDPDPLYLGALHPLTGGTNFQADDVVITSAAVAVTSGGVSQPTIAYSGFDRLAVYTQGGTDTIAVHLDAALPATIVLDGGNPSVDDSVTIFGSASADNLTLLGDRVEVAGGASIQLVNLESLRLDVADGGADIIVNEPSFRLSGNDAALHVHGDAADRYTLRTEAPAVTTGPENFSFANVMFDQSVTPDLFYTLPLGQLPGGQGVIVTGSPFLTNHVTGFPSSTSGFDESLSIGGRLGGADASLQALRLPTTLSTGDDPGATVRGGFELRWSDGRALTDGVGAELVLYESGTFNGPVLKGAPEPIMVQVHNPNTDAWSSWVYVPASAFSAYGGGATGDGAFATLIDLATFGSGFGLVDAFRFVNLIASDRMQSAVSSLVAPGETGPTSTTLPNPGSLASFTQYGNSTFDPDPLYVGVVSTAATQLTVGRNDVVAVNSSSVRWVGYHAITYTGLGTVAVETFGGADAIAVDPSLTTSIEIFAGDPEITTNPGDRVTLDLAGLASPLLTVTGVGGGVLTYGAAATVTLQGVDSLGGLLQPDQSVVPLDLRLEASLATGNDAYHLSRSGAALEAVINGQLFFRADLAVVNELQFNDPLTTTLADLQTLTVDFAGGDPIPQGGVFFHGGETGLGQTQITLENGSLGVVRHDLRSGEQGSVALDASQLVGAGSSRLHYVGVRGEILDGLAAERREFLLTDEPLQDVADVVQLKDDLPALVNHSLLVSADTARTFATVVFRNPAQTLVLETQGGDDQLFLQDLDPLFLAEVRLDTGIGDDLIRIDSNGALAGGTVDRFRFPIFISAGGDGADQLIVNDEDDDTGDVFSITDNTIGGGPVPPGAAVDAEGVPSPVVDGVISPQEWNFAPVAFATGPRPAASLQSILQFDFSAGVGTVVPDGSTNANTGYLPQVPAPQFRPNDGRFGGALEFNGTSDYAWFQDANFDVGEEGTLNFWVKMDTVSRRNQFFEGPGNQGLEFQYRENGGGQFYGSTNRGLLGNSDDFAISSGGKSALAGQWVNLQYTWKKTGASTGEMHVYVNGVEAYLTGFDSNIANWSVVAETASAFMTMGRDASTLAGSGNSRYFDGLMDDVAWFNTVLAPTELEALRTQTVADAQALLGGNLDPLGVGSGNLVAYWNLDDPIGVTQVSGDSGTNITLHLGPFGSQAQFLETEGKFGGALDFTNSESYATFQSSEFDVGARGSLSFWVLMRDTITSRADFFEGPNETGLEFQYRPDSSGQFYASPNRGTGNTADTVIQSGGARTVEGTWTHVVYTWDKTTSNAGVARIYLNGVETTYSSFNQNISGWNNVISTVNQLYTMGADPGTAGRWLNGKMDDVSWYNAVLSSTQIATIYNGGAGRSIDTIQGMMGHDAAFNALGSGGNLVAYWNLDDAAGSQFATGDGGTNITLYLNIPAAPDGAMLAPGGGPTLPGALAPLDALAFDGDRDVLRVLDSGSLDFDKSQGTIAFWVKPQAPNQGQTAYTLLEDTTQQVEVSLSFVANAGAALGNANLTQRIVFTPAANANGANVVVSGSQLALNEWTHVVITWNFADQSARIFLNGVEDAPLLNQFGSQWTAPAGNTGDWIYGGDAAAAPANRYFNGSLADAAIYGSPLSANQVNDIFTRGAGASGGWDVSGAQGRFAWDDTHLYLLVEGYPQGLSGENGPFNDLLLELRDESGAVLGLFDLASIGLAGGQVSPSAGATGLYELALPWTAVDGVNGFNHLTDLLQYRIRTNDADLAPGAGGFDSRDTTLGFEVIPPAGPTAGYKALPLARSETFFGTGGFVEFSGVADLIVTAGGGDDQITMRDNPLTDGMLDPLVNPSRSLQLFAGPGSDAIVIAALDANHRAAITVEGQLGVDSITQDGVLTLGSAVSTGNLFYSAETITVNQAIDTFTTNTHISGPGSVTFETDGQLTLAEAADILSRGVVEQLGGLATIFTAAEVTTTGDRIEFDGSLRLTGDVTLDSLGADAGDILLRSTVDSQTPGMHQFTLRSGLGNIAITGAVGLTSALGGLSILASHNVDFAATIRTAGDVSQVDGTGTTTFRGTSGAGIGGGLSITTDAVEFLAAGMVTVGDVMIDARNAILLAAGVGIDAGAALLFLKANQDLAGVAGFSQGSGSLLSTTSESPLAVRIFVGGQGDAAIAQVQTGTVTGRVTVDVGGAITDAQGTEAANITAFGVAFTAQTGIGAFGADLPDNPDFDLAVAVLTATTAGGDIVLGEQDAIQLQGLSAAGGSIRVVSVGGLISILDGTFLRSLTGQVSNAPPLLVLAEVNPDDVLLPGDPTQEVTGLIGDVPNQELGRNLTIVVDWADGVQSVLGGLNAGDTVVWLVGPNNESNPLIIPGNPEEAITITIQRTYPLLFLQAVPGTEIVSQFTVLNDSRIQLFDQSSINLNETVPLGIATSLSEESFVPSIPLPVEQLTFDTTEPARTTVNEQVISVPPPQTQYQLEILTGEEAENEQAILYLVRVGVDGEEESRTLLPLSALRDLTGLLDRIRKAPLRSGLYRIYHQEPGLPPRKVLEFRKTAEGIGDPVREPGRGANPLEQTPQNQAPQEKGAPAEPSAKQGAALDQVPPTAVRAALLEATEASFSLAARLRRRIEQASAAD